MTPVHLNTLESPPEELFGLPANELARVLGGPTLVRLPGKRKPPLFVSVLLHGNETSGWIALQRLWAEPVLEREVIVFIGNVTAAAQAVRSLPDQPDYNRVWRNDQGAEAAFAAELLNALKALRPMAALDIHNNTGKNPHYSVVTDLRPESLALASLFSDKAVYVEEPDTVLTRAMSTICPSFTIEAGPIDDVRSDERAFSLLKRMTALARLPEQPAETLDVFQAIARVHVPPEVLFDFADHPEGDTALTLTAGVEGVNFHALSAGTEFGSLRIPFERAIRVLDPRHVDVTRRFFTQSGNSLVLARPVIPAMYTTDRAVVQQDCLCYFMETL